MCVRQDADADSDPYLMTLHKLWTKMCEDDWRSAAKALFILHTVSRDCAPDQCRKFAAAMKYDAAFDHKQIPSLRVF